jgi:hypothetical protein
MSWQFATSPEDMEKLYRILLDHGAKSIGAFVIQEPGLEADDIWGVLAKTYRGKVLGYSADSDWSQCLSEMVMQYNFTIDEMIEKKKDIRVKWLGGDPGDNIPGIPAFKKNGERSKNNVGQTTATKMLENENWADDLHPDAEAALERNWMLTTLPCPGWDLDAVALEINELTVAHEQTDEFWQRYGITQPVRKHLQDRANRDAWISKLRLHLLNQVVPEG